MEKQITKASKQKNNPPKKCFGEFGHVKLTEEEHKRLIKDFHQQDTESAIQYLDNYIEEKGYKSKSHNIAIRRWVLSAVKEKQRKEKYRVGYAQERQDQTVNATKNVLLEIEKNNKDGNEFQAKFGAALGALAVTLGESLTKERINSYWEIFKQYDPQEVLEAIDQAGLRCEFFPKPAKILEIMTGGIGGGKDAMVAWQEAVKAMEQIGSYKSPVFEDGAIAAALEGLGGWVELCRMTYKEMTLQQIPTKFAALYKAAVLKGAHKTPGKLTGLTQIDNIAKGFSQIKERTVTAPTFTEITVSTKNNANVLPGMANPNIKLNMGPLNETASAGIKQLAKMKKI